MNPKPKIIEAIKALGYNQRQVTVKDHGGSLNWSYEVTVRDPKVNIVKLEKAVKAHQDIDYDQATQEVLGGANVFIHVRATQEVKEEWAKTYQEAVDKAVASIPGEEGSAQIIEQYSMRKEPGNRYSLYHTPAGSMIGTSFGFESYNGYKGIAIAIYLKSLEVAQEEEEKVMAYAERVVGYIKQVHGEDGLVDLENNPNAFASYARAYNEGFKEFNERILVMPSNQRNELMKGAAKMVYNRINNGSNG